MLLTLLVAAPLTGISQDWGYYRLGKTTVCAMAALDGKAVQYGACKEEPPERIKALKFSLPAAKKEIALKNGKLFARVTLDRPDRGAGVQRRACLGDTDRHCEKPDVLGRFLPRAADLDIVRVQGGKEVIVAATRGTPRTIKAMYASPACRWLSRLLKSRSRPSSVDLRV